MITLPASTYTLTLTGAVEFENATGDLNILSDITINGAGSAITIIDGNGTDRVFDVFFSNTVLNDLTVRNGKTDPGFDVGGCIDLFAGASLTIVRSTVTGCTSETGGGIVAVGDARFPVSLTIIDSTMSQNVATDKGGALYLFGLPGAGLTTTIIRSTISGNVATHGAGLYVLDGMTTIANSTISGNTATSRAGVCSCKPTPTVS